MPFFYCFFLVIVLSIVFLVIRSLVLRRKTVSIELFVKALKNENSGYFEDALVTYERALHEVNKISFNGNFKNKIVEKIQLLHTLIEYKKNSLRFIR